MELRGMLSINDIYVLILQYNCLYGQMANTYSKTLYIFSISLFVFLNLYKLYEKNTF